MLSDFPYIYLFWIIFFIIGLINLPLTFLLFGKFVDRGYIFSKILGLALISYFVFLLSTLKILAFSEKSIILVSLLLFLINIMIGFKNKKDKPKLRRATVKLFFLEELLFAFLLFFWSYIRGFAPDIHGLEKFMDFGFVNSALRTKFLPPLDMWLAPSPDYPYSTINYYYFGHYVTALLIKATTVLPEIAYNIMLGVLCAFTGTGAFSIALNLFALFQRQTNLLAKRGVVRVWGAPTSAHLGHPAAKPGKEHLFGADEYQDPSRPYDKRSLICALLAAFLVAFGGNLHTIYAFTKGYALDNPQPVWEVLGKPNINAYWYPNATRFIPNTIHEFPIYSFVVSDLHGHVLDIPFVLLTIAFLFSILISVKTDYIQKLKDQNSKIKTTIQNLKLSNFRVLRFSFAFCVLRFEFILLGLFLAIMYMTNAWDGIIYFGLAGLVLLLVNTTLQTKKENPRLGISYLVSRISYTKIPNTKYQIRNTNLLSQLILLLIFFFLFSLPFNRHFVPFAKGIGINCLTPNASNVVLCDHSPFWMMVILWGYFYFFALSFLIFIILPAIKRLLNPQSVIHLPAEALAKAGHPSSLSYSDIFITLLIIISTGLLIAPEFIFARDIYPAHYRANTMFKLGYQVFMMLGISVAYIVFRFLTVSPFRKINYQTSILKIIKQKFLKTAWWSMAIIILFLVSIYPFFAINSYYNGLTKYQYLDGIAWLNSFYPGDRNAVEYLRRNVSSNEQPTILEAVGESYTDYARISAYSGLPTVVGWPVHEWLWRGSYDEAGKRQEEVRKIYESVNAEEAKSLLEKYNVKYVVVGILEQEKYPNLNEANFSSLGTLVFSQNGTRIYEIKN